MAVLRKRKTPPPAPEPKQKKERKTKVTKATVVNTSAKDEPVPEPVAESSTVAPAEEDKPTAKTTTTPPKTGDKVDFDGFGGEVETNDGKKVSLKSLVEESEAGVVLFTYPKASTPGCTTQVCLFRDSYDSLTATGLSIYGLSTDSTKANTTFQTKQSLPYPLLCDPSASLITAIGLKKTPKGTQRGVFVVKKDGEVLAAEPGGPAATVEVVKRLVAETGGSEE
ncbi:AhpC-TSA-domain-containing protein [Penicillium taxi]|uniref:AhpC-TSA-domain-containing protein n=1 Tax=Penicillium taxi TaxID=168475 RepID=UPI0025459B0D|nr:AhpC-TSA-domain-containing protein [Penicillium taxi]KAJ5893222.1 AhpC-TSA-domain-containing protein [Penicillium taxi]